MASGAVSEADHAGPGSDLPPLGGPAGVQAALEVGTGAPLTWLRGQEATRFHIHVPLE